jgi:small subunit ribosomal protein S20
LATHKSALKRARQNQVRNLRNKAVRTKTKTAVNRARGAIAGGSQEEANEQFARAVSAVQKSVSKGILHKNTASRKVSRLAKQINRLSETST